MSADPFAPDYMEIWVTKYALTKGILHFATAEYFGGETDMVCIRAKYGGLDQSFHREGRDWHRTRAAAIKRAEEMREAKIRSLRKKVDALSKWTPDIWRANDER